MIYNVGMSTTIFLYPDLQNINLCWIGAVASTLHPLDGKGGDIDVRGSSRAKAINSDFQCDECKEEVGPLGFSKRPNMLVETQHTSI